MSKSKTKTTRRTPPGSDATAQDSSFLKLRWLSEINLPRRPLLRPEEEVKLGRGLRSDLARLDSLVRCHPLGFERILSRMEDVLENNARVYAWFSMKDTLRGDYEVASAAYTGALRSWRSSPRRARSRLARGLDALSRYGLEPEFVIRLGRDILDCGRRCERTEPPAEIVRLEKLIGRTLERIARQRDDFIVSNLRLVLKEVLRYQPKGLDRADLYQEGVIGLQKAAYRFEPGRGTRFSTYATYWIRQSVQRYVMERSSLVRVPMAVQEQLRKDQSKLPENEAEKVRQLLRQPFTSSSGSPEEERPLSLDHHHRPEPEPHQRLSLDNIEETVGSALESLKSKERFILEQRFGIGGRERRTLEEIGGELKLSRERIRQIETEALRELSKENALEELYEDLDSASDNRLLHQA